MQPKCDEYLHKTFFFSPSKRIMLLIYTMVDAPSNGLSKQIYKRCKLLFLVNDEKGRSQCRESAAQVTFPHQ